MVNFILFRKFLQLLKQLKSVGTSIWTLEYRPNALRLG